MYYLEFVFTFLLIPIVGLFFFKKKRTQTTTLGLIIHLIIAVLYTVPWDNYLIKNGIWYYDEKLITGTIFLIPIGEYLFILLQTTLICLIISPATFRYNKNTCFKYSSKGLYIGLLFILIGVILILFTKSFYLSLILLWASVPFTVQLSVGFNVLKDNIWVISKYCFLFTFYFSIIDSYALGNIWFIAERTSLGINIGNIPIEEIIFFCCTSLFVLNGMCLWFKLKLK